jgi:Fic family protein
MRRRDREGCDYEAYIPDPLVGRTFRLDGDVAADVADAELAVARFNASGRVLASSEALARLLLRAESVASSYLEGLVIGGRRLLRAEQARADGVRALDVTAEEVLGNIDAMTWAVDELSSAPELTVDALCEVHRRLLEHVPLMRRYAGVIRTEQNWIGGNGYNPCTASYVPPPPEHVEELLADLCAFANGDALPAVAQAAIVHSQFEAIHPFADGNGRAGRALIHVVLRRRGLAPRVLVPISLVLATRSRAYIAGLQAMCYRGSPDSAAAHEGLNEWVGTFAAACSRAVADATAFDQRVAGVQEAWREAVSPLRADSAAARLIEVLPGAPVVTAQSASELIGRSFRATNEALRQLEEAKVVKQVTVGRRNRAFEAPAIMEVFTGLERQMASPVGDTRVEGPGRAVPPRAARGAGDGDGGGGEKRRH